MRSHRIAGAFTGLPALIRWGLATVVAGGLMDATYHLAVGGEHLDEVGLDSHLVTLLGMVVTMGGVLGVGLRQRHVEPERKE